MTKVVAAVESCSVQTEREREIQRLIEETVSKIGLLGY